MRSFARMEGLKGARETLQEFSKAVARNTGVRALTKAARVLEHRVEQNAKVSNRPNNATPGSLKAAPQVVRERGKGARVAVIVDDIAAVPKEFGLTGRNYPADPFFRPAIDATQDDMARVFTESLVSEVEATAAKIAKRKKA